jgi:hypothetical protein
MRPAHATECQISSFEDIEGTEVGVAVKAAGIDWNVQSDAAADREWPDHHTAEPFCRRS